MVLAVLSQVAVLLSVPPSQLSIQPQMYKHILYTNTSLSIMHAFYSQNEYITFSKRVCSTTKQYMHT